MRYYFFHLMSWPYLPDNFAEEYDSAWVWLPNQLYDPVKGHDLYQNYLDTLAYADELGFDGICVNEHHQNAYGLMPSPNLMAAALTQRTKRCQDRRHRQRPAAVQSAAARGRGVRHARRDVERTARRRHGHRRRPGILLLSGQSDPCPRTLPRGARSDRQGVDDARPVSVELEALFLSLRQSLAAADSAAASAHLDSRRRQPGNHRVRRPAPLRLHGHSVFPYRRVSTCFRPVPRSVREGRLHRPIPDRWAGAFRSTSPRRIGRPARSSSRICGTSSAICSRTSRWRRRATPRRNRRSPFSAIAAQFLADQKDWDAIEKGVFAIVGSPETVRQKLDHYRKELGVGVVLTGCQTGTLPHELARKSMEMLAKEVLPACSRP